MLAVVRKQRDSFFRLVVAPAAPGVERGVGRGIARRRVGTVLNVRDSRSLRVVLAVVAVLCFVLVGTPRVVAQTSTAPRQEVPSTTTASSASAAKSMLIVDLSGSMLAEDVGVVPASMPRRLRRANWWIRCPMTPNSV